MSSVVGGELRPGGNPRDAAHAKVVAGNGSQSGFYVNNLGTAPVAGSLRTNGPAAAWLSGMPAQLIVPSSGRLTWLVDKDAASLVSA